MSPPYGDIEMASPTKEYLNGFPSVAQFIAQDKDKSSTVYRRFDRLAARNLLYQQSRLQQLEKKQQSLDDEDLQNGDLDSKRAATCWEEFEALAKVRERERERMETAEEIEKHLRAYHKSLLLHSGVLGLNKPAKRTLKAFKKWFEYEEGKTRLRGESRHILDDEDDEDDLTNTLDNGVIHISEHKLSRFVNILSILIAAVLLIGAIVALNYIQSQDTQMGLIAVYIAMFAGSVGLLTSAGRAEVFAATAAYAAVLVVFVSGIRSG